MKPVTIVDDWRKWKQIAAGAIAALRKCEWHDCGYVYDICPCCDGTRAGEGATPAEFPEHDTGHAPGCELAAILASAALEDKPCPARRGLRGVMMAHECPYCGQECYCDMDDIGAMPIPSDCPHLNGDCECDPASDSDAICLAACCARLESGDATND